MLFSSRRTTTASNCKSSEDADLVKTLNKVQAVIWFKPDGTILSANENFCAAVGYQPDEIVGQHHRIFAPPGFADTSEYADFWRMLASGTFHQGQYRRIRKDGSDLWIQATYNPIFDSAGKVTKIVKFATDVTKRRTTIDAMLEAFRAQAEGDFAARIPPIATGQLGEFSRKFNESLDAKESLFQNIAALVGDIDASSGALSSHAHDVARVNTSQADELAHTLDAVQDLTTLVTETVDRLRESRGIANDADRKGTEGVQVVGDAASVMARIKEGSTRIEKIVGVIDSIAFQTNLLSLNASVEAARAGDAGRGFAVVAQEVRTLAQDTARESSEIRELIRQSVEDIGEGVSVVERVGRMLEDIKTSISEIVSQSEQMDEKCDSQVAGIQHVSNALVSLEETSRTTANRSRDALKNAEHVSRQANQLDQLVRSFASFSDRETGQKPVLRAAG